MIRYPVTEAKLREMIERESPGWLKDAAARTKKFRQDGRYSEEKGNWSAVKGAYMDIQKNKCAYCEEEFESKLYGKIYHDIEHFRPKNGVKAWPPKSRRKEFQKLGCDLATGDDWNEGYYLLAYHPFNYATACKACNSVLKKNYFPIGGPRGAQSANPKTLKGEKPYLIYPLGSIDGDNPENLITFNGIHPQPKAKNGTHKYWRAWVTIHLFALDGRERLLKGRAERIIALDMARTIEKNPAVTPEERQRAADSIERLKDPSSAHSNCVRCFDALYQKKPAEAEEIVAKADEYLNSLKGKKR
jgi:hypothetical protein